MNEITINIYNTVGSEFCIEADDGEKVYTLVSQALKNGKKVTISFLNVTMLTSAFLNVAIGQLYRDFSSEVIKNGLNVTGLDTVDKGLLKRVTDTAKLFYKDPDRLSKSIDEIMEG